jgi:peptidoglycan-N-acetylglucosamine deacetylase
VKQKLAASLSLDVDNLWSYMKTRGEPGWESRPSYLTTFIPYVLEVLDHLSVKITFFIVGADAAEAKNHAALRAITDAGHEVGNHSYEHEPWLQQYSDEALEREIDMAHRAIVDATGREPSGFAGRVSAGPLRC